MMCSSNKLNLVAQWNLDYYQAIYEIFNRKPNRILAKKIIEIIVVLFAC